MFKQFVSIYIKYNVYRHDYQRTIQTCTSLRFVKREIPSENQTSHIGTNFNKTNNTYKEQRKKILKIKQ